MAQVQLDWIEYDSKWSDLSDLDQYAENLLEQTPAASESEHEALRSQLVEYLQARRKTLETLSDLSLDYATRLANVDAKERSLVETVDQYTNFIDAQRALGEHQPQSGPVRSPSDLQRPGLAGFTSQLADRRRGLVERSQDESAGLCPDRVGNYRPPGRPRQGTHSYPGDLRKRPPDPDGPFSPYIGNLRTDNPTGRNLANHPALDGLAFLGRGCRRLHACRGGPACSGQRYRYCY